MSPLQLEPNLLATGQVISDVLGLITCATGSTKVRLQLRDELIVFDRIFQYLKDDGESERWRKIGENLVFTQLTERLTRCLQSVEAKLRSAKATTRPQSAQWPFSTEEVETILAFLASEKPVLDIVEAQSGSLVSTHEEQSIKLEGLIRVPEPPVGKPVPSSSLKQRGLESDSPASKPTTLDQTPIPFMRYVDDLKHLPREGWRRFIRTPESVASHSLGCALLGFLAPPPLDNYKCAFIGLFHDLAESVVGDIPSFANIPKSRKHELERTAFEYLVSLIRPYSTERATQIMGFWEEYEEGTSEEGAWMKQMDKFDCILQSHCYEQRTGGEKGLEEFQGLQPKIIAREARDWLNLHLEDRAAWFRRQSEDILITFITGNLDATSVINVKTVCTIVGAQYLGLDDIISDPQSKHAQYKSRCDELSIALPARMVISMMDRQMRKQKSQGTRHIVVCGFPRNASDLVEFKRSVQNPTQVLYLNHIEPSQHNEPAKPPGQLNDDNQKAFEFFTRDSTDTLALSLDEITQIEYHGTNDIANRLTEFLQTPRSKQQNPSILHD
ncbi:hypothetical protein EDB81DRAFT_829671 [Dactylonectria macrodidyma]|uniref:5'-deoxynucleotidase n=1 Tax=Dactylonectria macrodidyma TaxID=307937 RepID=A0A9P9D2V2_9HYPO|nr:hypothetical protein EDB81DRAFT_829671 [Dactylonectria macrodidyma]